MELSEQQQRRQRRLQRAVIIGGLIVWAIQGIRIAGTERGDFNLHYELGRRLAAGTFIYHNGLDYPYPPFWALVHAPLTNVPMHVAQLMLFPLFLVAFVVLMRVLDALAAKHWPQRRNAAFWTGTVAVLLASRYLVRDMPECGVNLALVALSWLAVYLWTRRREWLGGLSLGFAISLKCTPLFFLAYFGWKRQWKMFATSSVFTCAFCLSPLLFMGPKLFDQSVDFWSMMAWRGVGVSDPSHGVLGPEPLQNDSLRPAMARFLIHLPDDHKARLDHPLYGDFLNLDPDVAGAVIKLLLLTLVLGIAWKFRSPVVERNAPEILWECAAISVLILLISPITWGQHCVGVLPAFYLFSRSAATGAVVRKSIRSGGTSMEEDDAPGVPEWVVTYGDMMSLLLTFFIMLVSLSEVVADKKYRAVLESIQKYIGYRNAPDGPTGKSFPLNSMIARLETLGSFADDLRSHGGVKHAAPPGQSVRVFRTPDGKSFMIGDPVPYRPWEAGLSPAGERKLREVALQMAGKPNKIELRGHVAPGSPPAGVPKMDKTLLGYLRCRTAMRFLIQNGVERDRMRIVSFGDTQPLERSDGTQAQIHDRVEIHITDKFTEYYRGSTEIRE
eukprot:g32981.t1